MHSGDPCAAGAECDNTCNELGQNCFTPQGTTCTDDGKLCTLDICDGSGNCTHPSVPPDQCPQGYAVLRASGTLSGPPQPVHLTLGHGGIAPTGHICADTITSGYGVRVITGSVVGTATGGVAIDWAGAHGIVGGDVVTGGGTITGAAHIKAGGVVDPSGTAPAVEQCDTASADATSKIIEFSSLPVSPGYDAATMTPLFVARTGMRTISLAACSPNCVIDTDRIKVGAYGIYSRLALQGAPNTAQVIVRVGTTMLTTYESTILLENLTPEQVLYIVNGTVSLGIYSRIGGTIYARDKVTMHYGSVVEGALLSSRDISTRQYPLFELHPFVGW